MNPDPNLPPPEPESGKIVPAENAPPPAKKVGWATGCNDVLGCFGCFFELLALFTMLMIGVGIWHYR